MHKKTCVIFLSLVLIIDSQKEMENLVDDYQQDINLLLLHFTLVIRLL